MANLGDMLPPINKGADPQKPTTPVWKGRIAQTPEHIEDGVMVTLENRTGPDLMHGPCPYEPIAMGDRYGIPSKGDRAQVSFNEEGMPWVVCWWPQERDD